MVRVVAFLKSLFSPAAHFEESVHCWQQMLALEDWHVVVQVVDRSTLDDGTLSGVNADPRSKTAVIRIFGTCDSGFPGRQARADQLLTIAHEMAHLSRLNSGDQQWQEGSMTPAPTMTLLQQQRRWRELSVVEP